MRSSEVWTEEPVRYSVLATSDLVSSPVFSLQSLQKHELENVDPSE